VARQCRLRYLNPALPFLAILASHEVLRVWDRVTVRRSLLWIAVVVLWAGLVKSFSWGLQDLHRQEQLFLNGGLILVCFLLGLQIMELVLRRRHVVWCQTALAGTLLFSLVWASALTFGVDYQMSARVRSHFLSGSRPIAHVIEGNPLIITFQPDYLWPLLESGKSISIANEANALAGTDTVPQLAERALKTRPVYWLASPQMDPAISRMAHDLHARGIEMESLLSPAAGLPYHLFKLTKGE
jgi:peptidoglycan/LPS O-acetylase OafA/YrhL